MAINYNPKIVTDSIRCLLDARDTRSYPGSGLTWSDLSGYKNNQQRSISGVTFNSDGYFTFDGAAGNFVQAAITSSGPSTIPNSFSADNASSTIGVWFRPHTVTPASRMAVITDNFGPEYGIWVQTNGNVSGYAYGGVSTSISANVWTYCVITVVAGVANTTDTYTLKFYKDGVYVNQATGTVGNGLNDWPLTLGYDNQSGSPLGYFDGDIARVEMYQKVLTDAEVQQNYNALRGRFGL